MTKRTLLALFLVFSFAFVTVAEARIGGGGSSGFRGSRGFGGGGFGARSYSMPQRQQPVAPQQQLNNPYGRAQPGAAPAFGGGGGFMRGMVGGIAGGFLGSMLFRSMGWGASTPGMGGEAGGLGLLEILLIAGGLFLLFRYFIGRAAAVQAPVQAVDEPVIPAQGAWRATDVDCEDEVERTVRRYDPAFSVGPFKEARIDDFFKIQAAWMGRDLSRVSGLITPELYAAFDAEAAGLRSEGRINKLENIAVRTSRVVEGWQETGKEYVTVWLKANVLDYTVDERSGAVLAGSQSQPVPFEEYWTYSRDVASPGSPWRLTAIEQAGQA